MSGADIGSDFDIGDSKISKLSLDDINIGGSLNMTLTGADEVSATFARVRSNITLVGSLVKALDLGGASAGGELSVLGWWADESRMSLRNTSVGVLSVSPGSSPEKLDLVGFTYQRLGGLGDAGENDMSRWSPKDLRDWLKLDPSYSPQPYEQLAKVLRDSRQS